MGGYTTGECGNLFESDEDEDGEDEDRGEDGEGEEGDSTEEERGEDAEGPFFFEPLPDGCFSAFTAR